jgi:ribosome-associated toxin RatA of RatAB toxin-antitoxin module
MRTIEIQAIDATRSAAEVFPVISDFEQYQNQCDAVRSVVFTEKNTDRSVSKWEVNFRQGIMRWTELDVFDMTTLSIRFEQLEGDAKHFSGAWLLSDVGAGCLIRFVATFDMGVPSISDIIEPIAEKALQENIESILRGLLGDQTEIVSTPHTSSQSM